MALSKKIMESKQFQEDMVKAFQADVKYEAEQARWAAGDLSEEEKQQIREYEAETGYTLCADKSKW